MAIQGDRLRRAIALLALIGGSTWSEVQRRTADDNAILASENLDLAFEASEELLTTIGQHELISEPGADPTREAMTAKALAYYERLRGLCGDDPPVDQHVARTHFRIAELMSRFGRADEARTAW